jgi:hypothetical protein
MTRIFIVAVALAGTTLLGGWSFDKQGQFASSIVTSPVVATHPTRPAWPRRVASADFAGQIRCTPGTNPAGLAVPDDPLSKSGFPTPSVEHRIAGSARPTKVTG